jgi:hypothetical protein
MERIPDESEGEAVRVNNNPATKRVEVILKINSGSILCGSTTIQTGSIPTAYSPFKVAVRAGIIDMDLPVSWKL